MGGYHSSTNKLWKTSKEKQKKEEIRKSRAGDNPEDKKVPTEGAKTGD